ncbi:hypothetical protein [Devosia sp.]|uniref:hypothetical protein n=1 Tax=Devosia sp. TaxID=1871048 RepID=UPI003A8CE1A6
MAKLALAVEQENWIGAGQVSVPIDRRTQSSAARQLANSVLLYRRLDTAGIIYVGEGRVAALHAHDDDHVEVVLNPYRAFDDEILAGSEAGGPGARRSIELTNAEYARIVSAAPLSGSEGALEDAVAHSDGGLSAYTTLHDEVLRRWDYRCAITELSFAREGRPHPNLRIVAIRPREWGGPLDPANYLPLVPLAEQAWRNGVISLTDSFEIVTVLSQLGDDLREALPQSRCLLLPEDSAFWPAVEHVSFHRLHVFGEDPLAGDRQDFPA